MRANSALVIEPAESWKRLQGAKEFFIEGKRGCLGVERPCFRISDARSTGLR